MQMKLGFLVLIFLMFSLRTWAQSTSPFVSAADQDLTVKSVTAVPFTDNIKGIYANPLYKKFLTLLAQDRLWSYQSMPEGTPAAPLDLEEKPDLVKNLLATSKADGLFTFRVTKGPRGLNGKMTFFSGKAGLPLIQEELRNFPKFELAEAEKEIELMYSRIKARLPYRGLVLSRRGQEVTVNLGFRNGIKNNDQLTVVQFLKLNRHPKLKIMVSSEKEIMGKIKVFKTDEYLSFGFVTYEREVGAVQPQSKLLTQDFIQYNEPVLQDGKVVPGLENRQDRDLSYGSNPREWLPQEAPQYGRIALLAGIGSYNISSSLNAGATAEATSSFAPEIAIKGELWISSEWNVLFNIRQSVFSVPAPPNATPGTLNMSLSSYSVLGAYNFLMSPDFFGPKIQLSAGYSTYNSSTDRTTPLTFTNTNYGGLLVGFAGQFPLTTEIPMDLGAQFNMFISPGMTESPSTAVSSKSTINQFGFFGVYHVRSRFKIRGEINFEYYATAFGGAAANSSNTTQKMTSAMGGIEYLF
ncbi:MAG: hypothetical protein H7326_04320 [Bdellovibrionaceae bacterium]|nr:hypothetical protein [Pseudobdellovibrionaceae bacterium]